MESEGFIGHVMRHLEGLGTLGGRLVPQLLAVLAILAGGWVLALVLAWVTRRLVRAAVAWAPFRRWREASPRTLDEDRTAKLAGRIVFWTAVAVAFMAATEALELPVLTAWLGGIIRYVPRLLVAALLVLLGMLAGRAAAGGASRMAAAAGSTAPERLGAAASAIVVTISVLIAIDHLGVEIAFLTTALLIALAALLGGAALAFGLGARTSIANILAAHYVRQSYEVGQRVRIDGIEGRVLQLQPAAVVLETKEGQTRVPADVFARGPSVLLSSESAR